MSNVGCRMKEEKKLFSRKKNQERKMDPNRSKDDTDGKVLL